MICPKCKAEYRPGFTSCADCHVLLVTHLPQRTVPSHMLGEGDDTRTERESDVEADFDHSAVRAEPDGAPAEPGDPNRDPFCSFWKGTDLRVCTELCTVLDEAGIPHKTIRRQDHLFNLSNQSPYEVGVPASLYEKAELAIKDAFGTDEETGEDAVPLLSAPGGGEGDFENVASLMAKQTAEANEWLGPHYPEDATVEVWSGKDMALCEMIEMSLQENDVRSRSEEEAEGTRVFVLPGDQGRAKEIVREIVEGAPLGE